MLIIFTVILMPVIITGNLYTGNFKSEKISASLSVKEYRINVFIGGACDNEGWFTADEKTTYKTLLDKALYKSNADLTLYPPENVINEKDLIKEDGVFYLHIFLQPIIDAQPCIIYYINGNFSAHNLNKEIVDKIINGKPAGGYKNKNQLSELGVLTQEEFDEIKYRLYCL